MMKGKKKLTTILATLLLTISLFMAIPFPAHAAPGAELIIPDKVEYSPSVDIGDTTTIAIYVNTTEKVRSWEIAFTYNTSFLSYVQAIEGPFLQQNGTTIFTQSPLNSSHGVGNYTQGTGSPADFDQMLCMLVFLVLDYGKADIEFVPGSCSMVDDTGSPIALTFQDGSLEVEGKITVEIESFSHFTPVRNIGDSVLLDLTIDTQENISSWEGGFRYDPTVINCTAVLWGDFFNYSILTVTNTTGTIHPTNGTVWGFGQSVSAGSADGTGTLATLVFQILDYGKTAIELSQVDGETIEFKVKDRWGVECTNLDLVDGSYELRTLVEVSLEDVYLTTATHSIGDTFTADLTIDTAESVSSWQAGFYFDNTIVNCTGVSYGTYFNPAFSPLPLTPTIDNAGGKVTGMGQALFGGLYATGSGVLATITFEILDYGKTTLDLTELDLDPAEFLATDNRGDELTMLSLDDGSFEFRAGVSVKLSFIDSPYPSIGGTLTLELRIYTIEDVTAWQSGVCFDNTVLNCTSVTYGNYFNPAWSPLSLPYTIDNAGGKVTGMGQALFGGLSTTGDGLLATITFNVTGSGWKFVMLTDLNLDPTETIVTDQNGDECSLLLLVKGAKLKGDVNGNGAVESGDLIFGLAPAIGSFPGDYNWNPDADFNCNGAVESGDLIFGLAPYYGTNYGGSDPVC